MADTDKDNGSTATGEGFGSYTFRDGKSAEITAHNLGDVLRDLTSRVGDVETHAATFAETPAPVAGLTFDDLRSILYPYFRDDFDRLDRERDAARARDDASASARG